MLKIAAAVFYSLALITAADAAESVPYSNGCPKDYPLNCGNKHCCALAHTLWCGHRYKPGNDESCLNVSHQTAIEIKELKTLCEVALTCK
jgi:hypothetical protein